jgi:hypothetical protein
VNPQVVIYAVQQGQYPPIWRVYHGLRKTGCAELALLSAIIIFVLDISFLVASALTLTGFFISVLLFVPLLVIARIAFR